MTHGRGTHEPRGSMTTGNEDEGWPAGRSPAGHPSWEQRVNRPALSIVLPCYNEAENLPPLLARYAQVWEDLPAELILVDNGSTDHTEAVLRRELPNYPFARTVKVE